MRVDRGIASQLALMAAAGTVATGLVAGCIAPQRAVRDADERAYDIIQEKRQAALGSDEPFTIERPEDELRRRLMLDQRLPAAGAASFGRAYLPPVPKEPAGVSENLPLPEEAIVIDGADPQVRGVKQENFATDLFLVDIGRDPAAGAVRGEPYPDLPLELGPPTAEQVAAEEALVLSLIDALQVGARNSRAYQSQKEFVYIAALDLDLERDQFEFRFSGLVDADVQTELEGDDTAGVVLSPALGVSKLFKSGAAISTRIGLDLARLLTGDGGESLGLFADASITIPLLRGAGKEVVTEPLQQAERDAIYAIWDFENFKRDFAIDIVSQYYGVLQQLDQARNAADNYDRLLFNFRRSEQLFAEGRLPGIEVDQVLQNVLQARERYISAKQRYEQALDSFKVFLGLPPDARVRLDPQELVRLTEIAEDIIGVNPVEEIEAMREQGPPATTPTTAPTTRPIDVADQLPQAQPMPEGPATRLATQPAEELAQDLATQPATLPEPEDPFTRTGGLDEPLPNVDAETAGPFGLEADVAIRLALENRLDLAIAYGEVADAQRRTVVAADGLQAGLDLAGSAAYGGRRGALSGASPDADLNLGEGSYGAGLSLDLPIEATDERNAYRISLINLDRAIRNTQQLEDEVKLDVLNDLRDLRVSLQDLEIQAEAIRVAQRRLEAANLLIALGRGETRDYTEAEDALVGARDAFTASVVDYRLAVLELQRDLGVLQVNEEGLYREAEDLFPAL